MMEKENATTPKEVRRIFLCAFDPLFEQQPKKVVISITEDLPESRLLKCLDDAHSFHEHQASVLADALFHSLPQGTLDRLLMKLMAHKVSVYRGMTR